VAAAVNQLEAAASSFPNVFVSSSNTQAVFLKNKIQKLVLEIGPGMSCP
jgi:hypothetical protein